MLILSEKYNKYVQKCLLGNRYYKYIFFLGHHRKYSAPNPMFLEIRVTL